MSAMTRASASSEVRDVPVPEPLKADLREFSFALTEGGLRKSLLFLNSRTPHRFTGVFRFDGDMLRSICLVDKWVHEVVVGEDVPSAQAYCAHLHATGEPFSVSHGPSDPRVPWMADSRVVAYCGAVILDRSGRRWGAICHFDTKRCDARTTEMPLLVAAAGLIFEAALAYVSPVG